jgi:hypothetical protein
LGVAYYPNQNWAYLAEGNHRLALAEALGLEQLPATLWRSNAIPPTNKLLKEVPFEDEYGKGMKLIYSFKGQDVGPLDVRQLRRDPFGDYPSVGNYYVPPVMNPYLLKYFQQ